MSNGFRASSKAKTRDYFEKAYRRETQAAWDAKWHALSVPARTIFLNLVKRPGKNPSAHSLRSSVSVAGIPASTLMEMTAAGFVEVIPARSQSFSDSMAVSAGVREFALRLDALRRYHLLSVASPNEFRNYVKSVFAESELARVLSKVLRTQQIRDGYYLDEIIKKFVVKQEWPNWVSAALENPLADRILNLLQQPEGPGVLVELLSRLKMDDPAKVRATVDTLIAHLVLVEDLHPQTFEILVGFRPEVSKPLLCANQPHERAPLQVCEQPKEVGPSGGVLFNDLRTFLMEVAGEPPLVRQDQTLFAKESERFQAVQDLLPTWLSHFLSLSSESRLKQSLAWARTLELVKEAAEGKQTRLSLSAQGQKWLTLDLQEKFLRIHERIYPLMKVRLRIAPSYLDSFTANVDPFGGGSGGDRRFLGDDVAVVPLEKGRQPPNSWDAKADDYATVRVALDSAFSVLKPGVYYRLASVLSHLVDRDHNPLHRGLRPDQVAVFHHSRLVPPQQEAREDVGRNLIYAFLSRRLIPLGCVEVAIDAANQICIARGPRFDAYFNRKVAPEGWASSLVGPARVVVQPDFSVIVIGLNPAPAAELAPFCERTTTASSQGAITLKITRDSVVKAVSQGLKPSEITSRLKRLASNEVPANVLREVEDWANWVRQVSTSTLTVIRCPDSETADRVMAALKRQAERLNSTLIAMDLKTITATERNKLRAQGIIVQKHAEAQARKAKPKKRKRGW